MLLTTVVELSSQFRFANHCRLDTSGVQCVLASGVRIGANNCAPWSAKAVQTGAPRARLAIAVPKRLVKSAVARNRAKRIAREAFRQHDVRHSPVDLLIQFNSSFDARDEKQNRRARQAVVMLLDRVAEKSSRGA